MLDKDISVMFKNFKTNKLAKILGHDLEVAAFLIVALTLGATFTSFAMHNDDVDSLTFNNEKNRPIVSYRDVNSDGVPDRILKYPVGKVEIYYGKAATQNYQ